MAIGAGENIPALIAGNRRLPRTNGIAAGYGGLPQDGSGLAQSL